MACEILGAMSRPPGALDKRGFVLIMDLVGLSFRHIRHGAALLQPFRQCEACCHARSPRCVLYSIVWRRCSTSLLRCMQSQSPEVVVASVRPPGAQGSPAVRAARPNPSWGAALWFVPGTINAIDAEFYPDTVAHIFIVNAPRAATARPLLLPCPLSCPVRSHGRRHEQWVGLVPVGFCPTQALFAMVNPFIDSDTLSKVSVSSGIPADLVPCLGADCLPTELGGTRTKVFPYDPTQPPNPCPSWPAASDAAAAHPPLRSAQSEKGGHQPEEQKTTPLPAPPPQGWPPTPARAAVAVKGQAKPPAISRELGSYAL